MRFGRLGPLGAEVPAVLVEDTWYDLRSVTGEIDGDFLSAGQEPARQAVAAGGLPTLPDQRIGAPIARPGKVVCIGLNYRDHAAETGSPIPQEPIVFMKDPATVVGPDDQVLIPRGSAKTDWEVELGIVIGHTARYLPDREAALACIGGYAIANDVSEREFQLERGGQWDKGKSCETFNPLGPYLVTPDEVPDPAALGLRLWVNGELRQDGTTADMIFDVAEIVRYLSQFMVLYPGDLVNTGTPAGVAMGLPGTPYLRPDDEVTLEISGLGRQHQRVAQA